MFAAVKPAHGREEVAIEPPFVITNLISPCSLIELLKRSLSAEYRKGERELISAASTLSSPAPEANNVLPLTW